jgi:predicted AAA+ superfamily ATPase
MENHLIFGSYPEILTTSDRSEKIDLITEIVGSYLLKDILELDKVKSSKLLLDLLRLLAFQVGKEVSLRELATQLGIDYKTVARYIDLFEKSFVLYNLRGYSRNLRKEITKKSKYYFYDNGIRNGIISNFNAISRRDDLGALWENFLVGERLKLQAYKPIYSNNYFWRTWDQKEIDFIEEREGKLYGYEFKWGTKKVRPPQVWIDTYPEGVYTVIDREDYLDFIT